jgi:hypothetical protein
MTAATSTGSDAAAADGGLRLGSFLLGRRIDEAQYGRPAVVAMEAVGAAGTPFDGQPAIVRCSPTSQLDADGTARVADVVGRLRAIRHRSLASVLEAGVSGGVAYVVEAKPEGARLSDVLARKGKLLPGQVRRLVDDLVAGLSAAHTGGLTHGRVTPAVIWGSAGQGATLGGYAAAEAPRQEDPADPWNAPGGLAAGRGMASDQYQLALTAAAALTGHLPSRPGGIRDTLPGVPGAVVAVLARATATRPEERYPDVSAFALAFDESITTAGDDLIAGIWEATGRKDNALAAVMLEMAQEYVPDHRDLPVLRVRMTGGSGGDVNGLALAGLGLLPPVEQAPKMQEQPTIVTSTPEEAAIAAILMSPRATSPANAKSKSSPWVAFAAGTFACLLLLVIATALTLAFL